MKIRQVRNATLTIRYAGKRFLIDPMLAEKGAYPGFEGTANSHLANPTVGLALSLDEILNVDAMIVTHTHPDHWDEVAKARVPKSLPIFVQHQKDAELVKSSGFTDIHILTENSGFGGVKLIKTPGQHGTDEALAAIPEILGEVCGVVFKHPDEQTLYLAGDTIWNQHVQQTLDEHKPDVVVLNCGDAQVVSLGSIIMGKEDVRQVYQAAHQAILIASHMESVNHCVLTRRELREFSAEKSMTDRLRVPEDGEEYTF